MIIVTQSKKKAYDTRNLNHLVYTEVLPVGKEFGVELSGEDIIATYPTAEMAETAMSYVIRAEADGSKLFVMTTENEVWEDLE